MHPDLRTSKEALKFKRMIIGNVNALYADNLIDIGNEATDA